MNAYREVHWFLVNYLLLNAYVFVLSAIQGVVLLGSYGEIPGWTGSPFEQVVAYAAADMFFVALIYGIPVLLVVLLAWRLAIRLLGHPRLTAYLVATLTVVTAAILIERTEPLALAIVLAATLGFAAIVRVPDPGREALARQASAP